MKIYKWILVLLLFILLATIGENIRTRIVFNMNSHLALKALHNEPLLLPKALQSMKKMGVLNCRAYWIVGILADALQDDDLNRKARKVSLMCDPWIMPMHYLLAPEDKELADLALKNHPHHPLSWFWKGEVLLIEVFGNDLNKAYLDFRFGKAVAPRQVVELYKIGLHLEPKNSFRWEKLGDMQMSFDKNAAFDSYLKSCLTVGSKIHGCWLAGQIAEENGDIALAIYIYRLSNYPIISDRATFLENPK